MQTRGSGLQRQSESPKKLSGKCNELTESARGWTGSSTAVTKRRRVHEKTLKSLDSVVLHSPDHGLFPGTRVPTRRSPIRIRESFHRSVNMFARTFSYNTSLQLSTVGQVPDGSLESSAAPRILRPRTRSEMFSNTKGVFRSLYMEG